MGELNDPKQEADLNEVRVLQAERLVDEAKTMLLEENIDAGQRTLWEARLKIRQQDLERLLGATEEVVI